MRLHTGIRWTGVSAALRADRRGTDRFVEHGTARVRLAWLGVVLGSAALLPAQVGFRDALEQNVPTQPVSTRMLRVADIDGDGLEDLYQAATDGADRILLGTGRLDLVDVSAAALPASCRETRAATLADIDGDGDPDLVRIFDPRSSVGAGLRLYRNDALTFVDVTAGNFPSSGDEIEVVAGDVDGDSDTDLLVASSTTGSLLFLNDGSGRFAQAASGAFPRVGGSLFEFADIDGDGDLDSFITAFPLNRVLVNSGGVFSQRLDLAFPGNQMRMVDIDGDGDVDVVTNSLLFLGNGRGGFRRGPEDWIPDRALGFFEMIDADGDGDLDVVDQSYTADVERLLLNDGSGRFTEEPNAFPGVRDDAVAFAVWDLDRDGAQDIVFGNRVMPMRLYAQRGGATRFVNAVEPRLPVPAYQADHYVPADVDGDGLLDLLFVDDFRTGFINRDQLLLGDGRGGFRLSPTPLPQTGTGVSTQAADLGDVDGDGDPDMLVGENRLRLALNDGTGVFRDVTARRLPVVWSAGFVRDCTFADADRDGDLDVVFTTNVSPGVPTLGIFINDGSGNFADETSSRMPPDRWDAASIRAGDLNGDGAPDLVVGAGTFGVSGRVLWNDGNGRFSLPMPVPMPRFERAVLADVDQDGDLDILGGGGTEPLGLARNEFGRFFVNASAQWFPEPLRASSLQVADFDADGDVDLLAGNRILWNSGTALRESPEGSFDTRLAAFTFANAIGDFDGDGDTDVIYATSAYDRVVLNERTQLAVRAAVPLGGTLELETAVDRRPTPTGFAALPVLSSGPGRVELPGLGTLRLDPSVLVPTRVVTIDPTTGSGIVRVPVPADPALAGVEVHAQAVLAGPGEFGLTNATRTRLLR